METKFESITVENTIKAPVDKVWKFWTSPEHITKWGAASEDWHTPHAENARGNWIYPGRWPQSKNQFYRKGQGNQSCRNV